ncbi:AMP-binding protein [Candidatus Palauibacter sp.]|uniref:AMP-binding protein n=1 Tax=Candidatus Palauibacter sp. TaxID=3101350 RepID=UPI003B029ADB
MGDVEGPISPDAISYGRRLGELARQRPDAPAFVFARRDGTERRYTWRELERASNRLARLFAARGLRQGDWLVIGLHNCPQHPIATLAGWKLGACVLPLSARLPEAERDGLLALADPALVVADWDLAASDRPDLDRPDRPRLGLADLERAEALDPGPLPDRISHPGKAVGSGGSTGRPKIIIDPRPWAAEPGDTFRGMGGRVGLREGQNVLIPGPLYHNAPYCWSQWALFEGSTVVLMERFDAELALDLLERHRIGWTTLVPTMMLRMARVEGIERRDFSALEGLMHTAAPCPPWVKRRWIELVGANKVFEAFGAAEAIGATIIRGDEWLAHEGSVGRPAGCEIRVLREDGRELSAGEVGELHFRLASGEPPAYEYRGSPPAPTTPDGFVSVGDLGWVDEEGYLFPADRRTDLIISGGANIYPLEVEAALTEHPDIRDVAVIGLPDDEWGKRVHAVILPVDGASPPTAELDEFCRTRLVSWKVPKSFELVPDFPRDEAGKIRRGALVTDRTRQRSD